MCADSETNEVCASCGQAAVDNIQLKKCACNLVQYCGVNCQKNHRPHHKKACKKRMSEIRDDNLFRQPDESSYGECPICCLPLPIDVKKWTLHPCCSQLICQGCYYADMIRGFEESLQQKCPFCREPPGEAEKKMMERVKANDPVAIHYVARKRRIEGDYEKAFEYFTKAASFGNLDSHFELSCMYQTGQAVEKDMKKTLMHLEKAAIGGHPAARSVFGCLEANNGRFDRSYRHFIIAAKLGCDKALDQVKKGFAAGFVKKEDYDGALRGHQAAVDATKSAQREEAYAVFNTRS